MQLRALLPIVLVVSTSACLETEEKVQVRADGSLHVELEAKGPVADLADGYPLPLDGPWQPRNDATVAWLARVGPDTGAPATRANAARLPERDPVLGREGDTTLAVAADFANVDALPRRFAPRSEPYATAYLERGTTLSIERKGERTVYVFERTYGGREFERYDAWTRMRPNLSDDLVRTIESGERPDDTDRAKLVELGVSSLRACAQTVGEDALTALYTAGEASLSSAGRARCIQSLATSAADIVTKERLTRILEPLLDKAHTKHDDEESDREFARLELDLRDAVRRALAVALEREGLGARVRNAVLGELEWRFTATDQTSDLDDENFHLHVEMPGTIVGGNYDDVDGASAEWTIDGKSLRDRTRVLRVVSVVE